MLLHQREILCLDREVALVLNDTLTPNRRRGNPAHSQTWIWWKVEYATVRPVELLLAGADVRKGDVEVNACLRILKLLAVR